MTSCILSVYRKVVPFCQKIAMSTNLTSTSGLGGRGGGGGWRGRFLSVIRPAADPKWICYYFETSIFGWLTLKLFKRRLERQNIEGSARQKTQFFNQNNPKTPFLARFFKLLPAAQQIWSKWGMYTDLESSKNHFCLPKKRSLNI